MDEQHRVTHDRAVDVDTAQRLDRLEVVLDLDRALRDAANRYSLAAQIVHRPRRLPREHA